MTPLISAGQMPAVTAAAHRTRVPVRPLQAKAAATLNSLPASVVVTATAGRAHVVPESRMRPSEGPGAVLLQHHSRRSLPLSAAEPEPGNWGALRLGLKTPARCELAPASATWPNTARASQRGAVPGQPGLRPGGAGATYGVNGSQAWIGGGR